MATDAAQAKHLTSIEQNPRYPRIPDYAIVEILAEESGYKLYRARQRGTQRKVLLKTASRQAQAEVNRLQHEFVFSHDLDFDGVVRALNFVASEADDAILVLEDPGGEPLGHMLEGEPLPLATALTLTRQLAQTLAELHRRELIHRDIRPANVLVDLTSGVAKLSGFGAVSQLSREAATAESHDLLQLDPHYLSPEQTGRIHRLVDYRTDYYSLGVLLFTMLSGRTPFEANDLLGVLHAHIAQPPPALSELIPAIPATVSAIVAKLLAKAAEERYQSGLGIAADLERCLDSLNSEGAVADFEPGRQDLPQRFELPQRLYGREIELERLRQSVDAAAGGGFQVCLVSGYAGVGKSALIEELRPYVLQRRGFFISGKWNERDQARPYAAVHQALRQLGGWLLAQDETVLKDYRQRLAARIGDNIGVLAELAPELRRVFAELPSPVAVPPSQAKHRLHYCVEQFLRVFATADTPLVIFLDDLQWADLASLSLLESLLTQAPGHCLVLGAYRDYEVPAQHPLQQSLAACHARGLAIETLLLRPLEASSVRRFLADTLRTGSERVAGLADLVYRKTAGNPLAIRSFLHELFRQGGIRSEPDFGWAWDTSVITEAEAPQNVIDQLEHRLRQLPVADCQAIVAVALSDNVDAPTVAAACGCTVKEAASHLQDACREGILLKQDARYRFVHDRVRESAYRLIPANERSQRHLATAQALAQQRTGSASGASVYAIAEHYHHAAALLAGAERDRAARLNLEAGRNARTAGAFPAALHYFRQGLSLLAEDAWSANYELALALYGEAAQAACINAELATAKQLLQRVHEHAKTAQDRIPAYRTQILVALAEQRQRKAQQVCLEALESLGISLPLDPAPEAVKNYALEVAQLVDASPSEPRLATDPARQTIIQVLIDAAFAAAWDNLPLFQLIACKTAVIALEKEEELNSPLALTAFAIVRCQLGDALGGHHTGTRAMDLFDRYEIQAERPLCHFAFNAFIAPYLTPLRSLYQRFAQIFQQAIQYGDLNTTGVCAYQYCVASLHTGRPLAEVEQAVSHYIAESERFGQHNIVFVLQRLEQVIRELRSSPGAAPYEQAGSTSDDLPMAVRTAVFQMMALYLWRRSAAALQAVLAAEDFPLEVLPGFPSDFYRCLILLDRYPDLSQAQHEQYFARAEHYRERLAIRAHALPESYQHKLDLVDAERLRTQGRTAEAMAHYAQSLEGARRSGLLHEEALAAERAAEFHLELEQPSVAALYLQTATAAYSRWGAGAKLDQLYERYPNLLAATAGFLNTRPHMEEIAAENQKALAGESLDLQSIEKAAGLLRNALDMARLTKQLMALVLEMSGAQRGLLIRQNNADLVVDAAATLDHEGRLTTPAETGVDSHNYPQTVLRYVIRTGETLALDGTGQDARFSGDTYLQQIGPASLLCLPLLYGGRVIALLYLEHRELSGVFDDGRLAATQLIATEAASALINARLYQNLKQEVEKRAQAELELREALAEVAALKDLLVAENVYLREEIESEHNFEQIVGDSSALGQILRQVELVAATEANVLILGETGTGKELIARALHEHSRRKERPLIKVNCAALPATLIESELFGHEKGAFTGALSKKLGRFELADQGTLFLDEIGDLPLELQAKLLRVLQEGEFERLGSSQTRKVDVRIIAATNRNLKNAVESGAFRSDLYYRLNVFPLQLPPLRQRREDIPLLVWYFINKHQSALGKNIAEIPAPTLDALQAYDWPGNVRELENLIERALILSPGKTLVFDLKLLPTAPVQEHGAAKRPATQSSLQDIEREHIIAVLEQCDWKIQGAGNAAERLELNPSTLRFRMKKLDIVRPH